jgi:anti-sigma B factor antagonist
VALSGELDLASAPTLRDRLLGVLRPDGCRLIVDLSRVGFCDASGLAVLVGTDRRARLLGGVLRLAAPTPATSEALRITGLDLHLDVFPTVSAAIIGTKASRRIPGGG